MCLPPFPLPTTIASFPLAFILVPGNDLHDTITFTTIEHVTQEPFGFMVSILDHFGGSNKWFKAVLSHFGPP